MTRRLLLLLTLVFCVGMAVPAQQNRNRQQQTQRRQQQTQRRQQPQQRRQQQTRQRQQQPSQREKLQQQQQQLRQQREANQRRKRELESQVQERMRDVLALGTEINDKQAVIDSLQSEVLSTDSCITLLNEQEELDAQGKRYLETSYRYLMSYNYQVKKDNKAALECAQKILEIKPEDEGIKQVVETLSKAVK